MRRYTVAAVRQRLAEALDEADRGVPVTIERRGVRYRLAVEHMTARRKDRRTRIEILDPAVARGQWTWESSPRGVKFRGRRP